MKSIAKNSIYNVIYKCLNVAFPLITAAYVSRVLMVGGVGKVSSAQNIVTYFTLLAALGLPTYGVIKIAEVSNDRRALSRTFSELFTINAVSTIVCSAIYYIMILTVSYYRERITLFAVMGLLIVFNIINVDWFYQGKEEFRYIMFRNMLTKLLSLVAIFLFVRNSTDFIVYALILTIANIANYLFNIIHIRKYVDISIRDIKIKQHLRPVFMLLTASVAIEIYTLADITMLAFIHGDKSVGYYSTAMNGIRVVRMLVTAISAVFLPRISYYHTKGMLYEFNNLIKKGFEILAFLTVPAMCGIILVADDMISILFGMGFMESIHTMQILAISILTVAFSNFMGYQILVTVGKERIMMASTIIGAIVNILLNIVLIPPLQHSGAAIASVITELCVTLVQLYAVKDVINVKIRKEFWWSLFLSNIFLIVVVIGVRALVSNMILRLITSVCLGGGGYLLISILLKNDIAYECIQKLKRRL